VADMVDYFAIDYGFVVNVVNVDDVDIGDGAVIEEMSAIPTAANEANAEISKAVINAAVEADVRAPETFVEKKHAAIPTPPRRSPQVTDLGSKDPGAGHPVIIAAVPGPVAGRPDIAVAGANGLLVNGQCRRPEGDCDTNLGKGSGRYRQHYQCEKYFTNGANAHCAFSCPAILRFPGTALRLRIAWKSQSEINVPVRSVDLPDLRVHVKKNIRMS